MLSIKQTTKKEEKLRLSFPFPSAIYAQHHTTVAMFEWEHMEKRVRSILTKLNIATQHKSC